MENINIEDYGYDAFYNDQISKIDFDEVELIPARIIEVQREKYKIINKYGERKAILKGSIFYNDSYDVVYPAIGDFVLVNYNSQGEDIIYKVLDRKSKFSRLDSYNRNLITKMEQIVATNFQYIFIMTSLNYDFNIKRLERYLATAWQSGAQPIILLTKADLCDNYEQIKSRSEEIAFGVPVIVVSSVTGQGIDEVKQYINPCETVVFIGSSGVGKSSLVNAIAGEEIMKVNAIREDDSKGRHTTTHRQLNMMKNGTMVIDTPGMRELEMWDVEDGVETVFYEIEQLSHKCKFSNCNHENEPGCAVKKALKDGELSEERWKNYIKLKKEARFAKQKEENLRRIREKANHKRKY